ncbi:MAG: PQQ-dependent sugar dehydrogenase [Halobacteriales archaeon]|nr:PQQ-dependent sugar dehydrogenase [Halobacteriales archaeon]
MLSEFTDHRGWYSRATPTASGSCLDLPWERPIHQAGTLEFGPDGYLYGCARRRPQSLQRPGPHDTSRGASSGIDVDSRTGDLSYGIPEDNPLVGGEGRDELYAWGLRNPWKMAFSGDRLIVGDVGQATWEEINVIEAGNNYGWPLKEGTHCHDPQLGTSHRRRAVSTSRTAASRSWTRSSSSRTSTRQGDPVGFAVIGGHVHTGPVDAIERLVPLRRLHQLVHSRRPGALLAATPQESGRVAGRGAPGRRRPRHPGALAGPGRVGQLRARDAGRSQRGPALAARTRASSTV